MPAYPSGTVEQQVLQQYSYLFQMAQQLNLTLEAAESSRTAAVQAAGKSRAAQGTEQEYQNLKSLIIKTADTVQRRMDQLSAWLEGEYVASSEFGSYVEKLSAYIEAHPDALTQYYSFCSDLQGDVDAVDAAFGSYKAGTEGYIRTGVVYYEGALPVYGVAVGQNLTTTLVDGVETVAQNDFRATFTAKRLSFWQDSTEVAYVSDNRLYIRDITVLDSVTLGGWKLASENGLAFQWIGG